MTPKVRRVHKASGRLRLRVAERRGDRPWLNAIAERIAAIPGGLQAAASKTIASTTSPI
ncbi:hypothetical protein [Thiocystis minor]|uniref:hypothetical protein n=1 Tax=Thiocystis minor TaxID=61597 RepID=UPI001913A77E|nr:hypothetical protein [Thiocystis minor]